jgi:hypothetical protein
MSLTGYRRAELERQRKEQLRLQQLRQRATGLLASCRQTIRAVTDPAMQQLVAKDLQQIQKTLVQTSLQISSTPEQANKQLKKTQKHLNKVIANAETTVKKWSKQQAQARAKLEAVQQTLRAEKQSANKSGQQTLAEAERQIRQAASLYREGRYDEMTSMCKQAGDLIEKAGQESFDESVRKEVVKGLLTTLTNMGFAVESPKLQAKNNTAGIVTLSGRMPSGKMARFEVNLDGRLSFDFDGYEGRACGKDLEKINSTLQEQFSVKLSGSQITWKNPDKIAKGARNIPSSGHKAGC